MASPPTEPDFTNEIGSEGLSSRYQQCANEMENIGFRALTVGPVLFGLGAVLSIASLFGFGSRGCFNSDCAYIPDVPMLFLGVLSAATGA